MVIANARELPKMGAFFKVKSKGTFHFHKDLLAEMVEFLKKYSAENGENIEIQFTSTEAKRVVLLTSGGAVAGATMGFMIGGAFGLCAGLAVGAVIGYELAHIKLSVQMDGDDLVVELS